jgi:cullin 1
VLRLIESQRNGETIDIYLVNTVLDSSVLLGLGGSDSNNANFDVYREHFETPLFTATENYYRQNSKQLLAEDSLGEYLEEVENWLKDEEDCAERCMNVITRKKVCPYDFEYKCN